MRVALGRPDGQTRGTRDLLEGNVEAVLERDNGRLRGGKLREATPELEASFGLRERPGRVAVPGDPGVLVQRLGPALRGPARLRDVLARVHDEPVQPGRKLRLAPELADPLHELHERLLRRVARVFRVTQDVQGDSLHPRRVPLAERCERKLVSIFCTANKNRVRKPLVDERPGWPQVAHDSTGTPERRLHAPTLMTVALAPDLVLPALRGRFGREYHHANETPTTQRMLPEGAAHGAVALAEHQSEGRGRLGRTWVDSALMFSVLLKPAPPVADWPELTLVAARAVAGAIGPEAEIKHPNDVLVGGRKVAGILAEASEHVVLGIGINVGEAAWPGAGWVDRDRLELLVDVLERLERGYDDWVSRRRAPG